MKCQYSVPLMSMSILTGVNYIPYTLFPTSQGIGHRHKSVCKHTSSILQYCRHDRAQVRGNIDVYRNIYTHELY